MRLWKGEVGRDREDSITFFSFSLSFSFSTHPSQTYFTPPNPAKTSSKQLTTSTTLLTPPLNSSPLFSSLPFPSPSPSPSPFSPFCSFFFVSGESKKKDIWGEMVKGAVWGVSLRGEERRCWKGGKDDSREGEGERYVDREGREEREDEKREGWYRHKSIASPKTSAKNVATYISKAFFSFFLLLLVVVAVVFLLVSLLLKICKQINWNNWKAANCTSTCQPLSFSFLFPFRLLLLSRLLLPLPPNCPKLFF